MFIQASISNRSWFETQWAKLLVLIVLIVPLLGMKKGNKKAAAVNVDLPSSHENANLKFLEKSGSLSFPGSLSQGRAADEVSFMQSPRKGPADSSPPAEKKRELETPTTKVSDEVPQKNVRQKNVPQKNVRQKNVRQKNVRQKNVPQKKLFTTEEILNDLKAEVFPREGEEHANLRQNLAIELFQHKNSTVANEKEAWYRMTMDLIHGGHFGLVSTLMKMDPDFFQHNRTDIAFSHEALAQLAKKTEPNAGDFNAVGSIIKFSDCKEFTHKDFSAKIKESSRLSTIAAEDQYDLRILKRLYKLKMSLCKLAQTD